MTPESVAIAILEAVLSQVGLPTILSWLSGKVSPNAADVLNAEYAAARSAADQEAKAVLGG